MINPRYLLPFLFFSCSNLAPVVPANPSWPVEETILDWEAKTGCLALDWDLRIESFSVPNVYARTLSADSSMGPVRSTTIYTGGMNGDLRLFRSVLLHELGHVHSPQSANEHTDGGLMSIHVDPEAELEPGTIAASQAWCALNSDHVKFYNAGL